MKTIKVQDNIWNNLTRMKLKFNCKTLNDVIELILKMIRKYKLETEIEMIQKEDKQ